MSRDRLAAMRAQQAAQRGNSGRRQEEQGYGNDNAGDDYASGYGRSQQNPGYQEQDQYSGPRDPYGNQGYGGQQQGYQQQYNAQPDYRTNRDAPSGGGGGGEDEETRGQRARDQRRRRPSQAAAAYEQDYGEQQRGYPNDNQGERYAIPPVPSMAPQQLQYQQPYQQQNNQYGGGHDESANYWEKNASSATLNHKDSFEDPYKQKSSKPSRKMNGYNPEPEMYEIPTLPKSNNNYGQQQQNQRSPSIPMSARQNTAGGQITSNAPEIDMPSFFNEIDGVRDSFRELESQIQHLDQLHSRNLQGTGSEELSYELEQVSAQTREMTGDLRKRIKALQETTRIRTHGQAEQERQVRKAQIESVRNKFLEIVQSYQNMEMRNRDRAKRGIERQYQIVRPDATPEEVRQVVEGGQEVQIFAQALRTSTRVANARGVLNEVQNRHEDIKKMAQTMMELQQLFQEMAIMVEEQDEVIVHIEQKAEAVLHDVEVGQKELAAGVVSAKGARKKRKICFVILLILLLVIGGVVAYVVVKIVIPKINANKAASANNDPQPEKTKTVAASSSPRSSSLDNRALTTVVDDSNAGTATTTAADAADPAITARAYIMPLL